MTELSWLCETLLDDKLGISDKLKRRIIKRIAFVEAGLSRGGVTMPRAIAANVGNAIVNGAPQAPSTIAAMMRHGDIAPIAPQYNPPADLNAPPGIVAATPAAQAAIAQRQSALAAAMSDKMKPEPGRTGPRKF